MDGISRTCQACQTELRPESRFCQKCGLAAGSAPPGPAPSGPGPDWNAPTATQTAYPPQPYQAPVPPPTRPQLPPYPRPQPPFYPPQPHPSSAQPYPPALPPRQLAPAQSYPPAAYDQRPYDQRPYEPQAYDSQGFEPFRGDQPPVPPAGGPLPGPPRHPAHRQDRRRSGWPVALWVALFVLLVGGGAAAVILLARPFSHPALREAASTGSPGPSAGATGSANPTAPGSGRASPGTSASTPAGTASSAPAGSQRQAATSVASMLSQSGSDRSAIGSAANDIDVCGPNLTSDPKVFDDAASSRKALLASLATTPGRAALPPALVSDLTQAWQASIAADQAYARWATDEISQGCVPNDTRDPGYQATAAPNAEATKDKTAFTAQWNPIAAQYGLAQYQPGQL